MTAEDAVGRAIRVVLTISSFRNDDDVIRLLEAAKGLCPALFETVFVVDSLPTGRLPALIRDQDWSFVSYEGVADNLGSAGNLARRLELASDSGADYACCLNHDGILDAGVVRALVDHATRTPGIGAVYPLRRITRHGGRYDLTGVHRVPRPFSGRRTLPAAPTTEVFWSSSNGALYALSPVRTGLLPWADLWMGWEDLGYGWLLHRHGYLQVVLTEAVVDDSYEYRPHALGPFVLRSGDKPRWYTYYRIRNLILVTRRVRPPLAVSFGMACRVAFDLLPAVILRDHKRERLGLYVRGLAHGLRGVAGKWRLP